MAKDDEVVTSGAQDLRAALKADTKTGIDYSEDFEGQGPPVVKTAVVAAAKPEETKTEVKPTLPSAEEVKRQEIFQREQARLQADRDRIFQQQQELIKSQQAALEASKAPKVEEKPLTEEQIAEMYQVDPVKTMRILAQQVAQQVRAETLAELQSQESVEQQKQVQVQAQQAFKGAQQTFQENITKVNTDNPELKDPEHELTKIYLGLEKEMPYLLRIPEGPIKAMEIARSRYELSQFKAGKVIKEEEAENAQSTPAVRVQSPRAASMVGGASRGTQPTATTTLTEEQKIAARRMRLTPEEYAKNLKNSAFRKEEAPRRRTA